MIWNVSTFFNELDVLEIKLETLDPLVDRFIIAEATVDQRGAEKPLVFGPNRALFRRWAHKLTYVVVDDMPTRQDDEGMLAHWERENFQRNALIRGMEGLAEDDLVLISDLDEIPYPAALEEGLANPGMRFPMDMHVYRLDWRWTERPVTDGSTAVVRRGDDVLRYGVHHCLVGQPDSFWRSDANGDRLSSGWHLAYQYDGDGIRRKTQAIADDAWKQLIPDDKKGNPDWWPDPSGPSDALLERCVLDGVDVFGRDHRQAERVGLEQLPPCVENDPARYAHMLIP